MPPTVSTSRSGGLPLSLIAATVALTVCAAVVGLLSWPRPVRILSGWQVAEVPGSLWALMIGPTVVCLVLATALTLRAADLRGREPLALAWAALVLLAAAALVWNALYSAALSTEAGPIIPIFHWLFTFVPALLAGWLFTGRTRGDRWAAALGTGVVTVPLLTLSWALLDSSGLSLVGVGRALYNTAVFGMVPLAGAVALTSGRGNRRSAGGRET